MGNTEHVVWVLLLTRLEVADCCRHSHSPWVIETDHSPNTQEAVVLTVTRAVTDGVLQLTFVVEGTEHVVGVLLLTRVEATDRFVGTATVLGAWEPTTLRHHCNTKECLSQEFLYSPIQE